jgi:hypothetical protein
VDVVVLLFFFGLSAGTIGKIKGSSFWIWFMVGLVLPGLGTLAALLYRYEGAEPQRRCPECSRLQPITHQVCTGCGTDLQFPDEVPSESPA